MWQEGFIHAELEESKELFVPETEAEVWQA
jgi:hypothetical protein